MAAPLLKHPHPEVSETIHHSPTPDEKAAIHEEMKLYLYVFGALMLLTLTTLGITSFDLAYSRASILAISVATIKASLVACFFMHLLGEKKYLFMILHVPLVALLALLIGIALTNYETVQLILEHGGVVY